LNAISLLSQHSAQLIGFFSRQSSIKKVNFYRAFVEANYRNFYFQGEMTVKKAVTTHGLL